VVVQEEGKEIVFSAKGADDPDLLIPGSTETLEYDWDFGDSLGIRRNAGLNVNYSFKVEGEYTVTLTVRDKAGSFQETYINIIVNITREDRWNKPENEPTFLEEWGLILILVIVGIIVLAIILAFILRREPLAETAEAEEKAHEELVAKQQQEALAAQERLQTLLGGTIAQASGPALPAATGEQAGMEALPAAPPEVAQPEPVPEPAPVPVETGEPVSFQPPPAPEPVPAEAPQPEPPAPPEAVQEQYTYVPPPTEGQ